MHMQDPAELYHMNLVYIKENVTSCQNILPGAIHSI